MSNCSVACGLGKRVKKRMMKRGPCPEDTVYMEQDMCEGTQCDGKAPPPPE